MKVGMIGLGMMGSRMAVRIGNAGHNQLVLYDSNKSIAESIKKQINSSKVTVASSIEDLAANIDVCITMVPSSKDVKEVLLGNEGVINNAKAGSLLIDCSTIDPDVSKELNEIALRKGLAMIDAPVSGGITGAENGKRIRL